MTIVVRRQGVRDCRSTAPTQPWLCVGLVLSWILCAPAVQAADPAPPDGAALARIKAAGMLVDGVEAASPPYEFNDNGEINGFDIELARLFAQSLHVKLSVIDTNWAGVIPSLYANKFDLIWSSMPETVARKRAVLFSSIYAVDQPVLIARAGDPRAKVAADLKGMILGSQLNSSVEEQAQKLSDDNKLSLDIRLYDHIDAAYLDLNNHNVDVVMTSRSGFSQLDKKRPGLYRIVLVLPPDLFMAVAARKQDADLIAAVNRFLAQLQASGMLTTLFTKWFGVAPLPLPAAG